MTFHPSTVCATVAPVLQALSTDPTYSPYLPLLHKVLLSRLLSQLSQHYSEIYISEILRFVAPLNAGPSEPPSIAVDKVHYDHPHIEAFVMGCAQRGELQVRVDHAKGSITFGSEGFGASAASPDSLVRTRVTRLATALAESVSYIEPVPSSLSEADQQTAYEALVAAANEERQRLNINRLMSARRAELLAELTARRAMEEQSRKLETARKQQEDEERRTQELLRKRERERIERELEQMKINEAKKLAETLIEKGTLKVDVKVSAFLQVRWGRGLTMCSSESRCPRLR